VPHRLRNGLVDRFVEADYFLRTRLIQRIGIDPEPQDAGAQRTVFGDELNDVEPAARPQHGVRLGRRFGRV
jgi:hypothetical protein